MPPKLFVSCSMWIIGRVDTVAGEGRAGLDARRRRAGLLDVNVVRVTSRRGWDGKRQPADLAGDARRDARVRRVVVTVTPTARPFCTAAQMLTSCSRARRTRSRYVPLFSTLP